MYYNTNIQKYIGHNGELLHFFIGVGAIVGVVLIIINIEN